MAKRADASGQMKPKHPTRPADDARQHAVRTPARLDQGQARHTGWIRRRTRMPSTFNEVVAQPAARPVNLGSFGPASPCRAAIQPTFAGFRTALVGVAFSQQPGRKPFGQEPPRPRTIAVMPGGLALPGM